MLKAKKDAQRTPPGYKNPNKGGSKNTKKGTANLKMGKYCA